MLERFAGRRTYIAAGIAIGSALAGILGFMTPECQQHALHAAVGLGLYGIRSAIATAKHATIDSIRRVEVQTTVPPASPLIY